MDPLAKLESLEALSIMNNRVRDLTPVCNLPHLMALLAQGNQIMSLKGIHPLPIMSVENQYIEWKSIKINEEYRIDLNGNLEDINGEVPLITAISPKNSSYDVKTGRVEVKEIGASITIFFHNQNSELPFSGEFHILFITS